MDETLFRILLGIGLLGWIRPLVDRPSSDQIEELKGAMTDHSSRSEMLAVSVLLLLLSVVGLIGMFFSREAFRWVYLIAVSGMIAGTWWLPVASNKPKRDIGFAEIFRVVDGAILALAFFGSKAA